MTNSATRSISDWYFNKPHDYGEMRGLLNHYLGDINGEAVWTGISNRAAKTYIPALVSAVKVAPVSPITPKTFKVQPAKDPSSQLPALARPNRVVDAMRKQETEHAAHAATAAANPAQAESPAGVVAAAGGKPVWTWVGLGLVALAGGWVWFRTRGR